MWQAVTADNRRMRETMRRSLQQLKQHESLSARIEQEEDVERADDQDIAE